MLAEGMTLAGGSSTAVFMQPESASADMSTTAAMSTHLEVFILHSSLRSYLAQMEGK